MAADVQAIQDVWQRLAPLIVVPYTDDDYWQVVGVLDSLIDVVGEDERHPLASLMDVIGVLIENYENEHVPEPGQGREVDELMSRVSGLSRDELAEFRQWYEEFDAEVWDREFEEDVESGKLDKLAEEAMADFRRGDV